MFAVVCLSVLACAFAAPQYYYPPPPPHHHHHHHHSAELRPFFDGDVFDTNKFWSDFSREMQQFEQVMQEFAQHFPKTESSSGLQGNQYKINVILEGFEEKEITVKARDGLVMIQAVHKTDSGERSYLDMRTLPDFVKAESGSWTYEQEHHSLKIVFAVEEKSISTTEASDTTEAEAVTTQEPDREEMESNENGNTNQDADVGVRGDNDISTNEIQQGNDNVNVESTTYAVDFNNEVEFVPVQMKRSLE